MATDKCPRPVGSRYGSLPPSIPPSAETALFATRRVWRREVRRRTPPDYASVFLLNGEWIAGRRHIPPIDCQHEITASGFGRLKVGRDLALFSRQQGKIVVIPEDRHNAFSISRFRDSQMHHEGEAGAWVFHESMHHSIFPVSRHRAANSKFRWRQSIQPAQVRVSALRRVDLLELLCPIQHIG